ncbi:MAG: sigma-54 dependent transcriptional regulator [Gammaproteobacteria bacterium]|nr:sigma-54 dependent transcriptional regulator [Gammaproteobacteria bacterium]
MSSSKILVVDDEPDIRTLVKEILEDEGFQVDVAGNAESARQLVGSFAPNLVLLDIWMPDEDGITLLKEWKTEANLSFPVIMMSGHGSVETAVEATRLGAYDFIEKPLSLAKLLLTIKHAFERATLQQENTRLRYYSQTTDEPIGKSQQMQELRHQLQRVAHHNTPVLIIGESGTDKEIFARYLHNMSERTANSFISVGVSSLSGENSAAELFGSEDEGRTQTGLVEKAEGGTLFLKDIADMSLPVQGKLQNMLDSGQFVRVGGIEPVDINVRVIAATKHNLEQYVHDGQFRDDFYYQLSVVPIHIPPLREHYEDIPELLEHYVAYFAEREGLPYRRFSVAAQNRLRSYHWPGNVRELKNLVQRLLILGRDENIETEEVESILGKRQKPSEFSNLPGFDLPLREAREQFERAYLEYQLKEADGSVSKVAKNVGMERTHLYRKMRSLGIELKPGDSDK